MRNSKQSNKESSFQNYMKALRSRYSLLPQKRLLLASILLHIVFFSLLFMNWQFHEPVKPIHIPQNISAHVVNADQLKV